MIVEDNPDMRRLLQSIVKKVGDSIFECADGAEALATYRENLPDWVLMDVEMREKDGLTATREIRSFFPQARVVIVTDHGDQPTRDAATAAGAYAFVTKTDLSKLRGIVRPELVGE
ncbi:MAG: response regulator [Pyrinomonadaceae bacterium]